MLNDQVLQRRGGGTIDAVGRTPMRRALDGGLFLIFLAAGYLVVFRPDHKLQRDAQSLLGDIVEHVHLVGT